MEKIFDPAAAIAAQKKYTGENNLPHFAPSDGICCNCRSQIYSQMTQHHGATVYRTGIDVHRATTQLTTGCPHCNRSYCD
jgi:hypothetical protein